jgi:hypothetical protein
MRFIALFLLTALLLGACSHQDLKPPCQHPGVALIGGCGPLLPLNR